VTDFLIATAGSPRFAPQRLDRRLTGVGKGAMNVLDELGQVFWRDWVLGDVC